MYENLYDGWRNMFPITCKDICIDRVNAGQLLDFKKKCEYIDKQIITCRPIIVRNDVKLLQFFNQFIDNKNNFPLGIFLVDDQSEKKYRMIGRITLFDYNARNRSVELGYIVDEKFQGKGFMKRALAMVCARLLLDANINKIYAQTASFNKKSIGLLLSVGFVIDARLREHHEYNGKLYDDYIFSLLAEDEKEEHNRVISRFM
jgi:ribosomal-protein-alanine N-acetyltransferase